MQDASKKYENAKCGKSKEQTVGLFEMIKAFFTGSQ